MAVTAFAEINQRGGEESYQPDGTTVTTRTRTFRVNTNAASDDDATILSYASTPKIGAAHPNHSACKCCKRSCKPLSDATKRTWVLTVDYSTQWNIAENPLNDPARTEWSTENYQTEVFQDISGNAIVNSAGDPFDPTPEKDDSRWTSVTRKNITAAVPTWIFAYQDAVNSDTFTIDGITIGAGLAKISAIHLSEVQERNSTQYRVVTVTIHYRGENEGIGSGSGSYGSGSGSDDIEPWHLNILDAGFRELVAAGSGSGSTSCDDKLQNIQDCNGEDVTAPVPLDGEGVALDPPTSSSATFLQFQVYHEKAFQLIESIFT